MLFGGYSGVSCMCATTTTEPSPSEIPNDHSSAMSKEGLNAWIHEIGYTGFKYVLVTKVLMILLHFVFTYPLDRDLVLSSWMFTRLFFARYAEGLGEFITLMYLICFYVLFFVGFLRSLSDFP